MLKTLPEHVQKQVAEYLRGHSLRDTEDWCLDKLELEVSSRMLSEFREWYNSTGMLAEIKETADKFRADLERMPNVDLESDTIGQISQAFFETMALKSRDVKVHMGLRKLRLREKEQAIAVRALEQKVREYDEKITNAKAAMQQSINKGGISQETIEAIEQAMNLL